MKVCDICQSSNANDKTTATIDEDGTVKELELCGHCYNELRQREDKLKYQAYADTVEATTGKRPPQIPLVE